MARTHTLLMAALLASLLAAPCAHAQSEDDVPMSIDAIDEPPQMLEAIQEPVVAAEPEDYTEAVLAFLRVMREGEEPS